jgi:hypothetical protein
LRRTKISEGNHKNNKKKKRPVWWEPGHAWALSCTNPILPKCMLEALEKRNLVLWYIWIYNLHKPSCLHHLPFFACCMSWLHVFLKILCFGCGSSSIITPVLGDDSFLCPVSCVGNPVDHVKRKLTGL